MNSSSKITIFSDGIFDLFHKGHLKYLKKIKEYFNEQVYLIVGVINDELSKSYFCTILEKLINSCITLTLLIKFIIYL